MGHEPIFPSGRHGQMDRLRWNYQDNLRELAERRRRVMLWVIGIAITIDVGLIIALARGWR
jgi:hypothetical protein